MSHKFTITQYLVPEFYNKILKNSKIEPAFTSELWDINKKVEYLKYVKRGFPSRPIVLNKKEKDLYSCVDGWNRLNVVHDFMLGGFESYLTDEISNLIESMFIEVYVSDGPLQEDDLNLLRLVFHGSAPTTTAAAQGKDDVKIITQEKKITIVTKTRVPKKQIAEALKTSVWNKYIGVGSGEALCYCCGTTRITQREFDTGHVVAEINGGATRLDNLRPICRKCNLSMGAQNMEEFKKQFT